MELLLLILEACVGFIFLFSLVMYLAKSNPRFHYTMSEYYKRHPGQLYKDRKKLREGKRGLKDIDTRVYWLISVSILTILGLVCIAVHIFSNDIIEIKAIVMIFVFDVILVLLGIWDIWRGNM